MPNQPQVCQSSWGSWMHTIQIGTRAN